jgi:thiol-disulfide isomerase/thioredoxin
VSSIYSQGYDITFIINDYENDTLIVGYYYGEKQLVKDTVFASKKGEYKFKGEEKLDQGMYLALMKPDNSFVQFLINDEQKFQIEFSKNETSKLKFKNSPENTRFYEYMDFIKNKTSSVSPLKEAYKKAQESKSADTISIQSQMDLIDKDVKAYQNKYITSYPNTYMTNLIKSTFDVDLPKFEGTKEDVDLQRFKYYKKHFFDNTDFDFPHLIRTPFIHNKIDSYIKKLTAQNPDSIIISVDYLIKKLSNNPDAQKYYLSHFLNEYANSKIIGMDKIFVYMVDNYYTKGMAPWVKEDNMKKIVESANNIRGTLIGEIFPNITTYKEDGSPVMLSTVKSPYTLIIFWAPDCGHCKKSMPDILKFSEEFKSKGVTTITVCTKAGDKYKTCWEGVKEKGMEALINTGDEYQRYRQLVYIPTTPKLFILDEKKEILFKDLPAEELSKVMEEIIKMKEEKNKKSE